MTAVERPAPSGFVLDFGAVAERFAVAVGLSDLRAPVAACPGWSALDLVVHLGNVHAWAATIAETGRSAALLEDRPRSPRPRVVREWYVAKAEDLYQVLRYRPATAPCWTLVTEAGVTSFWSRRQLHETTVHLVDLDLANGRTTEVAGPVAADGIDEVLTVMLTRMRARGHPAALSAPLVLTATDTGDHWELRPDSPEPVPPRRLPSAAPGATTGAATEPGDRLAGPAAVLYRALWHRRTDDARLTIEGDERRVRAFLDSRLTP